MMCVVNVVNVTKTSCIMISKVDTGRWGPERSEGPT